eukprot:TRINITY_DN2680_c1_g1_i1.p1 TRINITY_DN2680_c1_g1~~TRINITY_DN2680_c1_g1_i1.p1  ORF type:complete len:430 (+),score=105.69 TRINITY_DN2680_c1_g1_i1:296-1585(+)
MAADAGSGVEDMRLALRTALRDLVDDRMDEKADEIQRVGRKMLGQAHRRSSEHFERVAESLRACDERQRVLEAENTRLKHALVALAARLPELGWTPPSSSAASSATAATTPATAATPTAATPPSAGSAGASRAPAAAGSAAARSVPSPLSPLGEEGEQGFQALKLPDCPQFPFPAQAAAAAPAAPSAGPTQLSLVNAIQRTTPAQTASANPFIPPAPPGLDRPVLSRETRGVDGAAVAAAALAMRTVTRSGTFSFTLARADDSDLGLNVSVDTAGRGLRVDGVRSLEGAVEAYNRLCIGSGNPERAVLVGDVILTVNDIGGSDTDGMLAEFKAKRLLKLQILRGGSCGASASFAHSPAAAAAAAAADVSAKAAATRPRAATVPVVPGGADAAGGLGVVAPAQVGPLPGAPAFDFRSASAAAAFVPGRVA